MWSCLAPIQMMLRYVLNDSVGDEVPDWLIIAHPLSTCCRRDRQGRDLELADVLARQSICAQDVSRTRYRDEVCQLPQLIMVPPTENLRYGIRSGDEEELSI